MADKELISQKDLDLTEAELNKIFFGSESVVSENQSIESQKVLPSKPIKLKRKEEIKIKPEPPRTEDPISPETEEPVETKSEEIIPEKKPQGRPKKWTVEKIQQYKEEKKRLREQRRIQRAATSEGMRLAKIVTNEPVTKYESEKLLETVIKTRTEIEEHLTNKRNNLKKIITGNNVQPVNYLGQKNKCSNHIYSFNYFDINGVVVSCKNCSATEHFEIKEWHKYIAENKRRL